MESVWTPHAKAIGRVTVLWTDIRNPWGNFIDMNVLVDGEQTCGVTIPGTAIEALNYLRTQVFDTDDARDWLGRDDA